MRKKRTLQEFARRARLVILLLAGSLCTCSAALQVTRIDLQVKNSPLTRVLQQIEAISEYTFVFKSEDVAAVGGITIEAKDAAVEEILDKCVAGTGLSYIIQDNLIIIRRVPQVARPLQIRGVVKDKEGAPLPGVTVVIKGTSVGGVTGRDGTFRLNASELPDIVVVFSFVGMRTVEAPYAGKDMDVTLVAEERELDNVVVTGIFNKAKESFTGAVSVITAEEIRNFSSRNLLQTLANIDPAFNLLPDNFAGSNPNNVPNLQIRGASSLPQNITDLQEQNRDNINVPLILLDGVEISLSRMMDLNERRVESVVLLKDASAAALYGSRAANGVVVITTLKPQPGSLQFFYDGKYAVEAPDLSEYRLLNAREKLDLEFRTGMYTGTNPERGTLLANYYAERKLDVERGVDTYWLSKPLRTTVPHRHNVAVEGGSEDFRYNMSLVYDRRNGVMKNSHREVISGEVSLTYNHDNFLFQNNLLVGATNTRESNYGYFSTWADTNPYFQTHDEEGKLYLQFPTAELLGGFIPILYPQYNPLHDAEVGRRDTESDNYWSETFYVDWKPIEGMSLRARGGISKSVMESHMFLSADHSYFASYSDEEAMRKGTYNFSIAHLFDYSADFTFSFNKRFGDKHLLFAGGNASVKQQEMDSQTFNLEGFHDGRINHMSAAMAYQKDGKPVGMEEINRNVGVLANVNYNYDGKYYADASLRADGNSAFGSRRHWGWFWSAGLGWNVHEEKFFQSRHVNYLKLRGSYGFTGKLGFNPFNAMMIYSFQTNDRYGNNIGARLEGLGNENLKWEMTGKFNAGIEFALFNNRISAVLDFYRDKTRDLVAEVNLPHSNGFKSYVENFGSLENRGWELKTTFVLLRDPARKMTWQVTTSMGSNRNKILEISPTLKAQNAQIRESLGINPNFLYEEGKSMRTLYAVPSLGISPSNGNELFMNRFGEVTDTWDARDQVDCGVAEPKLRGVLNTTFRFHDLMFNASFMYSLGTKIYNTTFRDKIEVPDYTYNVDRRVYRDRWQEPGDVARFKRLTDFTETKATSRFIQEENFFHFSALSLRYELGNLPWVQQRLRVKSLIAGFETSDLLYISSVKRERGLNYPFSRSFSMSLSAVF
ncbi:MAG: SusC/RagA family TonB-linked outer membrane protein [Odoribacteraceae bacterium]|jgi:TonB-linked SusC/RagA family outer membrane protein|nr:SusC/RagA family TonB-linked outer membrane protein [Odoribacteraceae bacterium]